MEVKKKGIRCHQDSSRADMKKGRCAKEERQRKKEATVQGEEEENENR